MSDLRQVFNDLIRFEIELWNAVDARLKREFDLPLTHFEPMSVMDRLPKCRVYDIASELGITTGGTSKLVDRIEASGYCRRLPNPDERCDSSRGPWPASGQPATAPRWKRSPSPAGTAVARRIPGNYLPIGLLNIFHRTCFRLRDIIL